MSAPCRKIGFRRCECSCGCSESTALTAPSSEPFWFWLDIGDNKQALAMGTGEHVFQRAACWPCQLGLHHVKPTREQLTAAATELGSMTESGSGNMTLYTSFSTDVEDDRVYRHAVRGLPREFDLARSLFHAFSS